MLLQLTRFKPSLVQTRFNFNPSWYALHINQTTCSAFTWASVLPQPFCVSHPASRQTPSTLKSFFRFLLCLYSLLATLCTCGVHFPASISLACVSSRVLFFSSFNSQLFVPLVLPTLSVHRISASRSAALIPSRFLRARTCNAVKWDQPWFCSS